MDRLKALDELIAKSKVITQGLNELESKLADIETAVGTLPANPNKASMEKIVRKTRATKKSAAVMRHKNVAIDTELKRGRVDLTTIKRLLDHQHDTVKLANKQADAILSEIKRAAAG